MSEKKEEKIVCTYCNSGYRLFPDRGENFCGFCGERLESLALILWGESDSNQLLYIDQQEPITLMVRMRNDGIVNIKKVGKLQATLIEP